MPECDGEEVRVYKKSRSSRDLVLTDLALIYPKYIIPIHLDKSDNKTLSVKLIIYNFIISSCADVKIHIKHMNKLKSSSLN